MLVAMLQDFLISGSVDSHPQDGGGGGGGPKSLSLTTVEFHSGYVADLPLLSCSKLLRMVEPY